MYLGARRQRFVVRYAWELHNGPLDASFIVRRTCGERSCVNPTHMEAMLRKRIGTQPIPSTKRCRDCGETQPSAMFPRKTRKVDGLESYCYDCQRARQRNYNLGRYGLTSADFESLAASQDGRCAACGVAPATRQRLVVDHDHKTGRVRGLLCQPCNLALGHSAEDLGRLRSLIEYLERVL